MTPSHHRHAARQHTATCAPAPVSDERQVLSRPTRRALTWLAVGCWLGLLVGCQGKPVGASCRSSDECERGLFCDLGVSTGYCSVICNQALPCPGHAVCARIEGTNARGTLVEIFRCLQVCGVDADCQPGIPCVNLSVGQQKVCFLGK